RSPRAARGQPHRHRRGGRPGGRGVAALRAAPRRDVDARLRRPDPARPPRMPPDEPALRPVPGGRRLPLLLRAPARVARRQGATEGEGGQEEDPGSQDESSMTRPAFERLVAEAITLIPRRFRAEMRNIAIVVEDEPSDETLAAVEIE